MTTGTVNTYDIVGIKEDVSDVISNIAPTKTPFQSMIGNVGIHNIHFEWQEDTLFNPAANAAVEGADAPVATAQATVLRTNRTQILTKTAKASGTADTVSKYGRDKELSYQLSLRSAEIKRDLEFAYVGTAQSIVAGNDTTARQLAGYQAQLDQSVVWNNSTSAFIGAAGTAWVPSTDTEASTAFLTEASVLTVAQLCYSNGAEPNVLMVKPNDASVIAGWKAGVVPFAAASPQNRRVDVENRDTKLYNVVSVYVTPFSEEGLKVVINRFIRPTDALVFEASMWKKATLRNWFRETLAKTGDSTNVQLLGEFSLMHKNYKASALITNLT